MPVYNFECTKCENVFESFHTIANMDDPLKMPCPSCLKNGYMIRLIGSPSLGEPQFLESTPGRPKPSESFIDVLRNMNHTIPGANIKVRE